MGPEPRNAPGAAWPWAASDSASWARSPQLGVGADFTTRAGLPGVWGSGGAPRPGLSRCTFHYKELGQTEGTGVLSAGRVFVLGGPVVPGAGDLPLPRRVLNPRTWGDV